MDDEESKEFKDNMKLILGSKRMLEILPPESRKQSLATKSMNTYL